MSTPGLSRGSSFFAKFASTQKHVGLNSSITGDKYSLIGLHSDVSPARSPGARINGVINQDTATASLVGESQSDLVLAVFDGHGDNGRLASRTVARSVASSLIAEGDEVDKGAVLAKAMVCRSPSRRSPPLECLASGTTAILVIAQQTPKPRLVTGCVGDSRAVLGRKPTSGGLFGILFAGGKSAWEAVSLSWCDGILRGRTRSRTIRARRRASRRPAAR